MTGVKAMATWSDLYYTVTILSALGLVCLGASQMYSDRLMRKLHRKRAAIRWSRLLMQAKLCDRGTVYTRRADPSPTPRRAK